MAACSTKGTTWRGLPAIKRPPWTADSMPMNWKQSRSGCAVRFVPLTVATMEAERYVYIDRMLAQVPLDFAMRWCEPGPLGCACLGCANGPEYGAGHLTRLG